ncbi:MAG: metallophosphoesterase [Archangium sp.]|nr:metallophosphoesterase [Archangium sp.]MDP3572167.1 metallophosphoesterase [Archangium sp.]
MRAIPFALLLAACPPRGLAVTADDRSIVVIAAGDIAEGDGAAPQLTATLVEQHHPAAVLVLGDAQYPNGKLEDFQRSYDPAWGRFKNITWPVPGNHEYWGSEAGGYFAYFGARAGDPGKGYYSFDLGDWHLIALNTNHKCEHVACDDASEQVKWLAADLAKNTKKCVLAYWHHPRFNSGHHGPFNPARPFWALFVKHQVELVLNGHEHFYERFTAVDESGQASSTGVVQLTVGTGGVGFSEFAAPHPSSAARQNDTYGVVKLRLGVKGWSSEFLGVPGSTFTDTASGECR